MSRLERLKISILKVVCPIDSLARYYSTPCLPCSRRIDLLKNLITMLTTQRWPGLTLPPNKLNSVPHWGPMHIHLANVLFVSVPPELENTPTIIHLSIEFKLIMPKSTKRRARDRGIPVGHGRPGSRRRNRHCNCYANA